MTNIQDVTKNWYLSLEELEFQTKSDTPDTQTYKDLMRFATGSAMSEPDFVFSQVRNLGYAREGSENFDIVFKVVIVTRLNNQLFYRATTNEERQQVLIDLVNTTAERVYMWYQIAVDIFEGYAEPSDPQILEANFGSSRRIGPNAVSVFGEVINEENGWNYSMTLTDQTDISAIYQAIPFISGLYEQITTFQYTPDGNPVDMNEYGDLPYRYTSAVNMASKAKRRKAKSAKKPTKPSAAKKQKDEEKTVPDIYVCNTDTDLNAVPVGKEFVFRISSIHYKFNKRSKEGKVSFAGYSIDAENNLAPSSDQKIFLYETRGSYDELVREINRLYGFDIGEEQQQVFHLSGENKWGWVYGRKFVSEKSGNAYYVNLSITRDENPA